MNIIISINLWSVGLMNIDKKSLPNVSIILLNWNGWKDTVECLESLYQITYPNYRVIVVDNHSGDDSLQKIREYCQGNIEVNSAFITYDRGNKPLKLVEYDESDGEYEKGDRKIEPSNKTLVLIKSKVNHGFSGGNNIGIRYALGNCDPKYVLLLNNDTVVDKDFLNGMVETSEKDEKIAACGPKILFYDMDGNTDVVAFLGGKIDWSRYPGYFHLGEYFTDNPEYMTGTMESDWLTGTAIMLRTGAMPMSYLDERYFFGCEDVDLCIRLTNTGYRVVTAMDSRIWHKCAVSRRKRFKNILAEILRDTGTNLRFLKIYNEKYYFYLPIYILQVTFAQVMILSNKAWRMVKIRLKRPQNAKLSGKS